MISTGKWKLLLKQLIQFQTQLYRSVTSNISCVMENKVETHTGMNLENTERA